jgi:hypothetical protein
MPSENRAGPAWLVGDDDDQAAAQLPGRLASIFADLPAIIVVPDSGQDDEDLIYRPLSGAKGATVGELRTAIAALNNSIETERRKASALESLLTMVSGNPAEDDLTVSEALRRVACAPVPGCIDAPEDGRDA